jgi:hypothetical protein
MDGFTPKYCEAFTQPQKLQPRSNFWLEPPNFSFQGTDQFMPFALFTTLLGRVRLSQGNRWLFGVFILSFFLSNIVKNHPILLLILGVLNPIKLTGGVHVSDTKSAYYGVGLIAPPNSLKR